MANKKKMNEVQKAIMLLYNFCNRNVCEFNKCPLYKDNYGCIIEIPDNWNIGELSITDFDEENEL